MTSPLSNPVLDNHFRNLVGLVNVFEAQIEKHISPIKLLSGDVKLINGKPPEQTKKIKDCWERFATLPINVPEFEVIKGKIREIRNQIQKEDIDNADVKALYIMQSYIIEYHVEGIFSTFKKEIQVLRTTICESLLKLTDELVSKHHEPKVKIPESAMKKTNQEIKAPLPAPQTIVPKIVSDSKGYLAPISGPLYLLGIGALGFGTFPSEEARGVFTVAGKLVTLAGAKLGKLIEGTGSLGVSGVDITASAMAKNPKLRNALFRAAVYWGGVDLLELGAKKIGPHINPLVAIPMSVMSGLALYHVPPLQRAGSILLTYDLQKEAMIISALMLAKYGIAPTITKYIDLGRDKAWGYLEKIDVRAHLPDAVNRGISTIQNVYSKLISKISFSNSPQLLDLRTSVDIYNDLMRAAAEARATANRSGGNPAAVRLADEAERLATEAGLRVDAEDVDLR